MSKFMKLSRTEMKDVLGGTVPGGGNPSCRIGECKLFVVELGTSITGSCSFHSTGTYSWYCVCSAGGYETNNGGTSCVFN